VEYSLVDITAAEVAAKPLRQRIGTSALAKLNGAVQMNWLGSESSLLKASASFL
jgi:hypothetical protein